MTRVLLKPLAILIVVGLLPGGSALADSSWTIEPYPDGTGRWIKNHSATFVVVGVFDGGFVWTSEDGGFTGEVNADNFPTPPDSVVSISNHGSQLTVVTPANEVWYGSMGSPWWTLVSTVPDTIGQVSSHYDNGNGLWFGMTDGSLHKADYFSETWEHVRDLGSSPVKQLASRGSGRAIALLEDGRLFVQDSVWVEAPFRTTMFSLPENEPAATIGHALEDGTHHLWRTTDGGLTWSRYSTALAEPDLAPWVARARRLLLPHRGVGPSLGLIACEDVLLASDDGGESWRVAASGTGMFIDLAVDNIGQGDIVTVGDRIHRSTDRVFSVSQIVGGDFSYVVMGSPWTYWALDRGLLFSIDRGKQWLRQPLPEHPGHLRHIAAKGDYTIWLHFDDGESCRTLFSEDRGIEYAEFDVEGRLRGLRDWSFDFSTGGWAVTDSTLLRSMDSGRNWEVRLDQLPGITALAGSDSDLVALAAADRVYLSRDGGDTWSDGALPAGITCNALAFSDTSALVGVGSSAFLLEGDPPWTDPIVFDAGDTLRDVALFNPHEGWAVGDSGLLLSTTDGGRTWTHYDVDLEINAFAGDLSRISVASGTYATTGTGPTMLNLLPDGYGPTFYTGISSNPYLPRYIDIHITAHERLLGDSVDVSIDSEDVQTELMDPEGFLFRGHYRIPPRPANRSMRIRGSDWLGNSRTITRDLSTAVLSARGTASLTWDGETLHFLGPTDGAVAIIEHDSETGPPLDSLSFSGRPFQVAVAAKAQVLPASEHLILTRWIDGRWQMLGPGSASVEDGAIMVLLRDPLHEPVEVLPVDILRVFPVPARDVLTIDWRGSVTGNTRWEIVDVGGRRLSKGMLSPAGPIQLQIVDSFGRPLATGVYWLRVRDGSSNVVRRFLIAR